MSTDDERVFISFQIAPLKAVQMQTRGTTKKIKQSTHADSISAYTRSVPVACAREQDQDLVQLSLPPLSPGMRLIACQLAISHALRSSDQNKFQPISQRSRADCRRHANGVFSVHGRINTPSFRSRVSFSYVQTIEHLLRCRSLSQHIASK